MSLPGWEDADPPDLSGFPDHVKKVTDNFGHWMQPDFSEEREFYSNWAEKIATAVEEGRGLGEGAGSDILPLRSARIVGNWLDSAQDTGTPTYTSVVEAIEGLVARGLAEYSGVDEDGEQQYVLTDEGAALADKLIQAEYLVGTLVVDGPPDHTPDGSHRWLILS